VTPASPTSIHWIITFGGNAGVLSQAATEAKNSSEFEDALQLIWPSLPAKATDNGVKDYHK